MNEATEAQEMLQNAMRLSGLVAEVGETNVKVRVLLDDLDLFIRKHGKQAFGADLAGALATSLVALSVVAAIAAEIAGYTPDELIRATGKALEAFTL